VSEVRLATAVQPQKVSVTLGGTTVAAKFQIVSEGIVVSLDKQAVIKAGDALVISLS
jgi:hypothetical protein